MTDFYSYHTKLRILHAIIAFELLKPQNLCARHCERMRHWGARVELYNGSLSRKGYTVEFFHERAIPSSFFTKGLKLDFEGFHRN